MYRFVSQFPQSFNTHASAHETKQNIKLKSKTVFFFRSNSFSHSFVLEKKWVSPSTDNCRQLMFAGNTTVGLTHLKINVQFFFLHLEYSILIKITNEKNSGKNSNNSLLPSIDVPIHNCRQTRWCKFRTTNIIVSLAQRTMWVQWVRCDDTEASAHHRTTAEKYSSGHRSRPSGSIGAAGKSKKKIMVKSASR